MALLAVIRLRGEADRKPEERRALELLRLHRVNHAVLVKDDPSIKGVLKNTLEYVVTYGEVDAETLAELIRRRGRLVGGERITEDYLKKIGFSSFEELAQALIDGKVSWEDLPGVKPVFRLSPPSKGFKGTLKKHVSEGGELGYRGSDINRLLRAMM